MNTSPLTGQEIVTAARLSLYGNQRPDGVNPLHWEAWLERRKNFVDSGKYVLEVIMLMEMLPRAIDTALANKQGADLSASPLRPDSQLSVTNAE